MSNGQQLEQVPDPRDTRAPSRVIDATHGSGDDPAEPWELPATQADLEDTRERSFERLPHRPASPAEIPAGAREDLAGAVGDLGLDQLFVIPRMPRPVGAHGRGRTVTPTQVIGVGGDAVAVWMDDGSVTGIRDRLAFADIVAILDRNILLNGRLELVGTDRSIVVRYNAVGRPELRELLLPVRRSWPEAAGSLPVDLGTDPGELPHKWRALVHSTEVLPQGPERLVVAAGRLGGPSPRLHNGVAALSGRELLVATDPTSDLALAQYGVDLLAVPRAHVLSLTGDGSMLRVRLAADAGPIEIRITADPSLVTAATGTLAPIVAAEASPPPA